MHILLYVLIAVAVLVACGFVVLCRHADMRAVRRYVRRIVVIVASFAFIVCLTATCLICCYSSAVNALKETFSAETIEGIKLTVKNLFDGGSAISALQTLIVSSFMFGFIGGTALGIGGFALTFVCKIRERKGGVEREQRGERPIYNNYVNRAFLVYERYNS